MPGILIANYLGGYQLACQSEQMAQPVELAVPPTVKSQSLLAFLILHRDQVQSRERLMNLFWGDSPSRRARRSLSTALWQIRRCFPDHDPIHGKSQTLQFIYDGFIELDVDRFEEKVMQGTFSDLQDATVLYTGNFLEGFYDDWVISERFRIQSLHIETLSKLMVLQEDIGDHNNALYSAQQLMKLDSLREDAHRLLMRVYCAIGQRNTALEQYHLCRQVLKNELDVNPMPETMHLFQAIQSDQYPIGHVSPVLVTPISPKPISTGRNPLKIITLETLVGREEELAFLNEQWLAAQAGQGRLMMVSGEAGVGKTRLLEKFAADLRSQGKMGLWGRSYEFERQLPYQPFAEALRPALLELSAEDLDSLPEWVVVEMGRLVPELLTSQPKYSPGTSTGIGQEQAHLFAGVAHFLGTLSASSSMLLVLEDLHWATESTLELLHYLARHLTATPIFFVGSYRSDIMEEQHPLKGLHQQLINEGITQALPLLPLSIEAVEQLVRTLSGLDERIIPLARGLYQDTEGNPFFVVETIKALFETGELTLVDGVWKGDFDRTSRDGLPLPARVSEVIQSRVQRLDSATQEALRIAAVLGSDFDFDLLTAIWGQDEEVVLDALDQLLRHQIIVDGSSVIDRDYVFTHHKIQEVVYDEISCQRRQYLHGRAGQEMEISYGSQVNEVSGELAFHYWQGRDANKESANKAAYYLLMTGDKALSIHANQDAISYFEQAISLLKEMGDDARTAETFLKLGQTYHTALDFQHSQQAYKAGFALRQHSETQQPSVALPAPPHPLRIDWCGLPQKLPDITLIEGQNWNGVVEQLFSGLVSLDEKMDIVPDVAHQWEILADGQRYVFHFRDDVLWSDGSNVKAIDFVYAIRRMLDPAVASPFANLFFDIKGARAVHSGQERNLERLGVRASDPFTLIIELEKPTGHMLYLLAQSAAFPIPHHMWDAYGPAWIDVANIVTNGPFRLQSWDPGRQMTLVLNPSYHGCSSGNVDQVELIWCGNERSRLEMYAANELDVLDLGRLPAEEMEEARRQFPDEYISKPWPSTNYVRFNTRISPFDDNRVRRAFAHAIDKRALARDALSGFESPALGGFIPPGTPGHSAEIGLPYDPESARQLLRQAGYPDGRGLPPIPLYSSISFVAHAAFLQAKWKKELGITLMPEMVTLPELANLLQRDRPFMFITGWLADYPDPDNFLRLGLQRFATDWQHSTFENLIDRARRIADQTERLALYAQADNILVNEAPILPLTYWPLHLLVKPWVRRYPTSADKFWFWKNTILDPH